jgi:hypothetical protein
MDKDHDRLPPLTSLRFGPDIQCEAVFADFDAGVGDGRQHLEPDVGDAIFVDESLGKLCIVGADVGRETAVSLAAIRRQQMGCVGKL